MADTRPATTGTGPQPVEVRLVGDDTAVRTAVAALTAATACGPATYRPVRHGSGTRAYLTIIVPERSDVQ